MGNGRLSRLGGRQELLLVESVSSLCASGITLEAAYAAAARALPRGPAAAAAGRIHELLLEGSTAREALEAAVSHADPMHLAVLGACDLTGEAAGPLRRAASHMRTMRALRDRTITVAVYPVFVLAVTVGGALLLTTVALPAFVRLALDLAPTAAAVAGRLAARGRLLAAIPAGSAGAVALAGVVGAILRRSHPETADRASLLLPVVGRIAACRDLFAFSGTGAALVAAGGSLDEAMRSAAGSVRNRWLRERLLRAAALIAEGSSPAEALAHTLERYGFAAAWLAVAYEGADLAVALDGLSAYLEREIGRAVERLSALIEPALVTAAGLFVVAVVVLLVRPLFDLYGEILPW